jgi:transposase
LADKDIESCIPPTRNPKVPVVYDKALYRQRHKVENMFAKLKDWRRIATRDTHSALRRKPYYF